MRPASQEGQTQTCPHGGLPLSSVFHGGVRQNMFSPKGRMFQREREEKGDELLCSQIHKSDCISLPCEQPLEKSDLMPCVDTMDTGAGSSPQDSRPGGRECQQWDVRRSPGKISLSNSWHGEDNPTFAFSWENIFLFLRCHMEVNWKKKSKN
nr:uncharacterized protein LOC106838971 isoform X2 [Equus asinus]